MLDLLGALEAVVAGVDHCVPVPALDGVVGHITRTTQYLHQRLEVSHAGEEPDLFSCQSHTVRFAGTDLVVETLTLNNEPEAILAEIGALAEQISDARYPDGPALSAA